MRVLTLEYHDVVAQSSFDDSGFPGAAANSYKLSLPAFEAHLDTLASVPNVGGDVRRIGAARPVLLTFDDGGASALDVIAPALERRGYVGHFFMTSSQIGEPGFLSVDALRELAARGHVIGSHSHTHPTRMARLTPSELDAEWLTSSRILSEILGAAVPVASVPGGYFSSRVSAAAERAGIHWLFTSEPVLRVSQHGTCRVLGRYTLRRDSSPAVVRSLVAAWGTGRMHQWMLWNAKKAAKAVAGDAYLKVRASVLGDRA